MKRGLTILTVVTTVTLLLFWLRDRKLQNRVRDLERADADGIEPGIDLNEYWEDLDDE
jgi:hypothetical protein